MHSDAIPQIHCETQVAGPERVPPLAVLCIHPLILFDTVHRECAGALQPSDITCAPIELQKKDAVAAGAVTQVRPLGQGTRGEGKLCASSK